MFLVTGGAGFIGSNLVARLNEAGHDVAVCDHLGSEGKWRNLQKRRLADFIARSRDCGRRCVRVIHGKGYRSGARGPVLKTAVDLWLRRHLDVMAFTSARAIDGGSGAVYVLLRG